MQIVLLSEIYQLLGKQDIIPETILSVSVLSKKFNVFEYPLVPRENSPDVCYNVNFSSNQQFCYLIGDLLDEFCVGPVLDIFNYEGLLIKNDFPGFSQCYNNVVYDGPNYLTYVSPVICV